MATCNLYRTYDEMKDNWESLHSLFRYYTNYNPTIYNYSIPGSFNDPDQVTRTFKIYISGEPERRICHARISLRKLKICSVSLLS